MKHNFHQKGLLSMKNYVAIIRGRENFGSLCIVPFIRGGEISRPNRKIIEETSDMTQK